MSLQILRSSIHQIRTKSLRHLSSASSKSLTQRALNLIKQARKLDHSFAPASAARSAAVADQLLPLPEPFGIRDLEDVNYLHIKTCVLEDDPNSTLIDVRESAEFSAGSIPNAHSVPLSEFASALGLPPQSFRDKYGFDKPISSQQAPVDGDVHSFIFFCRSGARSQTAVQHFKSLYSTNATTVDGNALRIYNYKGSWIDWVNNEEKLHNEIKKIQDEDS